MSGCGCNDIINILGSASEDWCPRFGVPTLPSEEDSVTVGKLYVYPISWPQSYVMAAALL